MNLVYEDEIQLFLKGWDFQVRDTIPNLYYARD